MVRAISPGDGDRVRQFLEGVVLQANSDVETPDEGNEAQTADPDDASENDAGTTPEDQDMTERLRAFAEPRTD